jgi:protein-S-isoprenylcysteine O-methyltransferase Ste14
MDDFIKIILPIYFIIYFGIAFVLKSLIVAKRIGKNPLVLPKDDSAYGLIGLYFKLTLIAMFVYVLAFAFFPAWHTYFLQIIQLDNSTIKYIGLTLLLIALLWTVIAQGHMKNSWRIGIDTETKTELVTTGLFGLSRNPIFFGMILSLVGLFLVTPNALTALFLILGYVLIQIQIRLEEEFLGKEHGQEYINYKQKVRRLI